MFHCFTWCRYIGNWVCFLIMHVFVSRQYFSKADTEKSTEPLIAKQSTVTSVSTSSAFVVTRALPASPVLGNVRLLRSSSPALANVVQPNSPSSLAQLLRVVNRPHFVGAGSHQPVSYGGAAVLLPNDSAVGSQLQRSFQRPLLQSPATPTIASSVVRTSSFQTAFMHSMLEGASRLNAVPASSIVRTPRTHRPGSPAGGIIPTPRTHRPSSPAYMIPASASSPNLMSLGNGSHILFDKSTGQIITNLRPPTPHAGLDDSRLRKTLTTATGLAQVGQRFAIVQCCF